MALGGNQGASAKLEQLNSAGSGIYRLRLQMNTA
jgi:hypothetical protein